MATGIAIALAGSSAWGHSFPPVRTVVLQVERCEVVLLVGFRPASGEASDTVLARAASQPKSQGLGTLKGLLTSQAMAPLTLSADGIALVPTKVRAKLGVEPGGARPMVVVLVSYALPAGRTLALSSRDPRTTRISWNDQGSRRIVISDAPAQGRWYTGVASFLLSLSATTGDSPCATSSSSASSGSSQAPR